MKKVNETILAAWKTRYKLRAEGYKLRAEGYKLQAEGDKLRAEGYKLRAGGDRLWARGDKLRAEGDKLWAEGDKLQAEGELAFLDAVISVHGNIPLTWEKWNSSHHSYECHLANGEIYGFNQLA